MAAFFLQANAQVIAQLLADTDPANNPGSK